MSKTLFTLAVAFGLSFIGCKKDKGAGATAAGSGSTMASGSAAGSATAGSSTGSAMAGSSTGSAMGSAATTGDRPASITPELIAANDKVTAGAKATVEALKAAGTDCVKMAAALDDATAKLKPDVDKLGAMLDKLDEAGQTYYADKMTAELGAAFEAMDPVSAQCKDNPAMQDAAKRYVKTLTGE